MKTRAEVVGLPEIVTMRRGVQAAYARLSRAYEERVVKAMHEGTSLEEIVQ